jgi:hypothetical protein
MNTDERFKEVAESFGFEVGEPYSYPRDLRPVLWRGVRIFNVPTKMNAFPKEEYRITTVDMAQRHFFECVMRLRMERHVLTTTPYHLETLKEMANQKFNPQEYELSE